MNEKLIFSIGFDESTGTYKINIPTGMTVNEVVFGFMALTKCLVRDGVVESTSYVTDMLNKYLTDPQFEEVENEEQVSERN